MAIALSALALFLIVQVTGSTEYGLMAGRVTQASRTLQAQLAVNQNRIPAGPAWRCEIFAEFEFSRAGPRHESGMPLSLT